MTIDRTLIKTILETLKREYPHKVEISRYPGIDTPDAHRALFYLAEKKLVTSGEISDRDGVKEILVAQITAEGLDYLEEEAVLRKKEETSPSLIGTEALREFLIQALSSSQSNNGRELLAISRLRGIGEEGMRAIVTKLIKVAASEPEKLIEAFLGKD